MTACPRGCENGTLIFMAANSWPLGLHSLSRRETLPCIGNLPALVRSRMFEEDLLLPRYYYTNTRLNCTPKLYPSAPQRSVALNPHQRSFSLQRMAVNSENHTGQKCRENLFMGYSVPVATSTTQLWQQRLREPFRKGTGSFEEPEDQEICWEIVTPRNDREASQVRLQQHDPLNKTLARTAPIDTRTQKGEVSQGHTHRQRTLGMNP